MRSLIYDVLYYIYVLLISAYTSIKIGCGVFSARERRAFVVLCPLILILQGICLQFWGMKMVWTVYPLITHLPIMLLLTLYFKARWDTTLASMVITYAMCQILRWIGLVINAFDLYPLVGFILHISFCHLVFLFFDHYCIPSMHSIVTGSANLIRWFASLPSLYYVYEYFMILTQQKYACITAFNELLPTAMVFFYILFVINSRKEMHKRKQAEHQAEILERELSQAGHEIAVLRTIETQTAIHRHDLRHHLAIISGLIRAQNSAQAVAYIREVEDSIDHIVSEKFCENETLNLLFGSFKTKADKSGISVKIQAALSPDLEIPDMELCALLSNGLENALHASLSLESSAAFIDVFCGTKQNKLLIEIQNAFEGEVKFQDGIPLSKESGHGFGCRSIQSIVLRRKGICSFETKNGVFMLRIALPLGK